MNSREHDEYEEFLLTIQETFDEGNYPLFTTDSANLWDAFITNIAPEGRQHYTCHACREFITRYGGLVRISGAGVAEPVMWPDPDNVPPFFSSAVRALRQIVAGAEVNGVFVPSGQVYGKPVTGVWRHMAVKQTNQRIFLDTAADLTARFPVLLAALEAYPTDAINTALILLRNGTLYRGDKILGMVEWFAEVHRHYHKLKAPTTKRNIVWRAVALAPRGFANIKNTVAGTLLDDLVKGLEPQAAAWRFESAMRQYMVSETPPTEGQVIQAERTIQSLGVEGALRRRYLSAYEVPPDGVLWRPTRSPRLRKGGVFSGIETRRDEPRPLPVSSLPVSTMTWQKFAAKVLPTALAVGVLVDNPARFVALVTASDELAPNILRWDNTVSWYYSGGHADADIRQRVVSAGGRYDDNAMRCSLAWEGFTDLDLHWELRDAGRSTAHVYFSAKRNMGVWLDVDANGGSPTTDKPVENIRAAEAIPDGDHKFFVRNYLQRGRELAEFRAELELGGRVYSMTGKADKTGWERELFKFSVVNGRPVNLVANGRPVDMVANGGPVVASGTSAAYWGVGAGSEYVPVDLIVTSPNLWGNNPRPEIGHHVFFILRGCRDESGGVGRGFFPEMLKGDLRDIRKTLNAYAEQTPVEPTEEPACGVGFSKDSPWGLRLRVTTPLGVAAYHIDRFD